MLSVVTVINRIHYTYLELNGLPQPRRDGVGRLFVRAFYWTEERTTVAVRPLGDRDPGVRAGSCRPTGSAIRWRSAADVIQWLLGKVRGQKFEDKSGR